MDNADLTFDYIRSFTKTTKPLLHLPFPRSEGLAGRAFSPGYGQQDGQMKIPTDDHRPPSSSSTYKRTSAIYHTAPSGPHPFLNTLFPAIQPLCIGVEAIPLIPHTLSDSSLLFQNSSPSSFRSLCSYCSCVQVQKTTINSFSIVADYCFYRLHITGQMVLLPVARCTHDTMEQVLGLSPTQRNFTGENMIKILASLADLKDTFDNCVV